MRFRLLVTIALVACVSTKQSAPAPLFEFHNNMWLNLHHFIRAVGRGMPAPGELTADERVTWDAAVAFYRDRYVNRDPVFDDGMVHIKNALRAYESRDSIADAAIDPELRSTLERIAPIYRKYWWPAHRASNASWIEAALPLIRDHGAALSARVAAAYGAMWPGEPIPVDLSIQAGPVGAYTTSPPTHTTISSTDPGYQGLGALEILFHEPSHAWGRTLQSSIVKASDIQCTMEATVCIVRAYWCVNAPGDALSINSVRAFAAIGLLNRYP
jgi:hypothetical protein